MVETTATTMAVPVFSRTSRARASIWAFWSAGINTGKVVDCSDRSGKGLLCIRRGNNRKQEKKKDSCDRINGASHGMYYDFHGYSITVLLILSKNDPIRGS